MVFIRERIKILICLLIITPVGFLIWRYYRGTPDNWARFYSPDVLYVIFWSLIFFFFWPSRANIVRIPVIVFLMTCILEFLQLWRPAYLESFRATLVGAALLGRSFSWVQFPFYVLGLSVSILILVILSNNQTKKPRVNKDS